MAVVADDLLLEDGLGGRVGRDRGDLVDAAGLTAADIAALSGRELDVALLGLERSRRRIEALMAAVIRRADESERYAEDGHRTVGAWAEATCNWSLAEARDRTRVADLAHRLPAALVALERGEIGVAQVVELGRLGANPRVRDQLPGSEAVLTDCARRLGFDEFKVVCSRWLQLADEDGAHHDHERAHEDRRAHASVVGRRFYLDAAGDVLTGSAMTEILDRFTDVELHADWAQAKASFGDDAGPARLERTPSQRRFDALKSIFFTAAGAEPHPGPQPLVNVTVDALTLTHELRRLSGEAPVPPDPATVLERRCETAGGHLVDARYAVVAALLGQVRRVLVDSSGRVLDLGRRRRIFTGAVREAVKLAGNRCLWPGCHVPTRQSQVDHVVPWAGEGATTAENGGLLCGRHNRFKSHGFRTWRDPAGVWHTYRPDGTEIAARPPP